MVRPAIRGKRRKRSLYHIGGIVDESNTPLGTVASESTNQKPRSKIRKQYEEISNTCKWWYSKITPPGYKWKPKTSIVNVKPNLIEKILFIVDSGCSKHITENLKLLSNFVEKFLGTVKFGNDQIAPILGYGYLVQGNITIKSVYYVEGLNHNLFSVGQFCDADLEVAFRKSTCYIRDLKGNDLLIGSRGTYLYSITLQDTSTPNPICLMAKASSSQEWLWHHENDRKKAETSVPKPLSALTVYPPNTPVKLVPRVLPTKSQVKINLYVLTQLFTEFDKTCKKRITPTGVTEGERGFEQTKRCYLTEVIPFFKTLKEHFAGVQTALFKEVKVMEEIFDQMNDEVDQNTVDKQCAEIVKKNLLIENENPISNCLSNQLLYDVEKSRCLDLEAEMSKVHNESKHILKLEREYLNLQLKYQHLQESFDNNKSQISQEAPDFNSFFKIKNLEHQIQEKDNVIRDLKVLVSNVNDRSCEPYNANDVKPKNLNKCKITKIPLMQENFIKA
ncbi:hypothetical protein Tco_1523402 [Tanacetum coccineum]